MLETVKEHPWITGGAIIGGIILYMMFAGGGGASASGGAPDSQVAAGVALQQWQAQLQDNADARAEAVQAHMGDTAAALEGLKIQTQSAYDIAQLAAGVQYAGINAGQNVSIAQINANEAAVAEQTKQKQIDATQNVQMQQIMANALEHQTDATVQIAKTQTRGGIFGGIINFLTHIF